MNKDLNTKWHLIAKLCINYTFTSPYRVEIIQELSAMVKDHLMMFYKSTGGYKPHRVIMYRYVCKFFKLGPWKIRLSKIISLFWKVNSLSSPFSKFLFAKKVKIGDCAKAISTWSFTMCLTIFSLIICSSLYLDSNLRQ